MDKEVVKLKLRKVELLDLLDKTRTSLSKNKKAETLCWIGFFVALTFLIIDILFNLLTTITVIGLISILLLLISAAGFAFTIYQVISHRELLLITENQLESNLYTLLTDIEFATRYESAHKGTVKLDE